MKTLALWCDKIMETSSNETKREIDIHINFWKIPNTKKKYQYFVDLGLMAHEANLIENLHIHFPFCVSENDVEDIGHIMSKDHKIVNAVFNENYGVTNSPEHAKLASVKDTKDKEVFSIYSIDFKSKDITFLNEYNGTKLSIKIPKNVKPTANKLYFRIRLRGNSIKYFLCEFEPKNWFFQSAFTSTDAIDFRINEKRNLNESLAEKIKEDQFFHINKVHFLLMRNAQDDLIADHLKINCRVLEVDLWKDYVGQGYNVNNIIAYHWSEKAVSNNSNEKQFLDSFNTWVKIKYHKSNIRTIFLYFLIIGLTSIIFNLTSTFIAERLWPIHDSSINSNSGIDIEPKTVQETTIISESQKNDDIYKKGE